MPKMGRTTNLESWQPFTGLRKIIENPRLRCWGNNCRFVFYVQMKCLHGLVIFDFSRKTWTLDVGEGTRTSASN